MNQINKLGIACFLFMMLLITTAPDIVRNLKPDARLGLVVVGTILFFAVAWPSDD